MSLTLPDAEEAPSPAKTAPVAPAPAPPPLAGIKIAAPSRAPILTALIVASLLRAALAVAIALCVEWVFNALLSTPTAPLNRDVLIAVGVFAGATIGIAGLEMFRAWASEKLSLHYVAELRRALFGVMLRAGGPAPDKPKRSHGGMLLPFVGDLTAIKRWVGEGVALAISAAITSLGLLALLSWYSPLLGLAAGLIMAIAAGLTILLSGPLNSAIKETRAQRGVLANFVSSALRSALTIQTFDRAAREERRLERRNQALQKAGLKLAALSGAMAALVQFAAGALIAATLAIGVYEVQIGAATIGTVAAAIALIGLMSGAVRELGVSFELWRRAEASYAKLKIAMAAPAQTAEPPAPKSLPRQPREGLVFERVAVEGVLRRVSAQARHGQIIDVRGPSGAGKSLLLALAARIRDPDRGRIKLDGRDLKVVATAKLRRKIGLAASATPLLRGSIAMNLKYRAPNATDAEIARIIEACNLTEVLARLPQGDRTRLSEGASELSRGEAQRLMIARALLGAPSLLILDDVDSHLDAASAEAIAATLMGFPGIVLMAGTSPALRAIADQIWTIERKTLRIETGPRAKSGPPPASEIRLQ